MTDVVPDIKPKLLSSSIESSDERVGRFIKKSNWYFVTTTTITLTAVTIVNVTTETLPIVLNGCIPDCLTSLPQC